MSHSQFHSTKLFILRHAWLNLWDKHMTTGRINQVTFIFAYLWPRNAAKKKVHRLLVEDDMPPSFAPPAYGHSYTPPDVRLGFTSWVVLFKNAKVLLWLQGQRQLWVPKDLHTHTPAFGIKFASLSSSQARMHRGNQEEQRKKLIIQCLLFSNAPSCWCELQAKVPRLLA